MPRKLVFGVGINDADYPVTTYTANKKQDWMCPYYRTWRGMLQRCYCATEKEKRGWYKQAHCCEEWLVFSNFKSWMEKQQWQGKALDKDFLVWGNKCYSPETCVFLPQEVNNFLTLRDNTCINNFIGVVYYKNIKKWVAKVSFEGKRLYLGAFLTEEEAHVAYLIGKIGIAQKLKTKYKSDRSVEKCIDNIVQILQDTLEKQTILRRQKHE